MFKRIAAISNCLISRPRDNNIILCRPFTYSKINYNNDNDNKKPLRKRNTVVNEQESAVNESPYISEVRKQLDFTTSNDTSEMPDFPSDIEHNKYMRSQERHAKRPKVDPDQISILLFPGQGAEYSGMATELLQYPNVVNMFKIASQILKYDLLALCTEPNNQSELRKTCHAHAATLVTSLAAIEMLKYHKPWAVERCIATSGYCVGEYAALVFAGSLQFEDAIRLVKKRSEIMQTISEQYPSGQVLLTLGPKSRLKLALHTAREVCRRKKSFRDQSDVDGSELPPDICEVASFLAPELKVVSGTMETLEFLQENYKEFGINKLEFLPASGAYNTKLMHMGKQEFIETLKQVELKKPIISVHSNVNGKRFSNTKITSRLLADQMVSPIRWEQTMHILYSREAGTEFPRTYAIMPGSNKTADLLKLTNAKALSRFQEVKC